MRRRRQRPGTRVHGTLDEKTARVAVADSGFQLVALDDLHGDQVNQFATAKSVRDLTAVRMALTRKEAWSLTTRPLDLAEVCEFWVEHGRVGSRLELMKASIDRRLEEGDQGRADARPIAVETIVSS